MNPSKLRIIIPVAILVIVAIGFVTQGGFGTLAAFGWQDISLLCPLGALSAMLASKTMIPRAVISIAIAIVLVLILGRAFCAWACPVPLVSKLRGAFSKKTANRPKGKEPLSEKDAKEGGIQVKPLTEAEMAALSSCGSKERKTPCKTGGEKSSCESCAEKRASVDSRHFILGGALASAAVFGFPVFCLICPIGLTFATILLVMRLFTDGDVTWTAVVVPALLLAEVVFFRKWCSHICPLSAFMSLAAKLNKTFVPRIDESTCLETTKGATCERCTAACEEGINLRHLDLGNSLSECTRCRACVDACPANAIAIPPLAKRANAKPGGGIMISEDEALGEAGGKNA